MFGYSTDLRSQTQVWSDLRCSNLNEASGVVVSQVKKWSGKSQEFLFWVGENWHFKGRSEESWNHLTRLIKYHWRMEKSFEVTLISTVVFLNKGNIFVEKLSNEWVERGPGCKWTLDAAMDAFSWQQRLCNRKSPSLSPMCPQLDSVSVSCGLSWVLFSPCSECFSPGSSVFLPPQKRPTSPNSNSTGTEDPYGNQLRLNVIYYLFIYFLLFIIYYLYLNVAREILIKRYRRENTVNVVWKSIWGASIFTG